MARESWDQRVVASLCESKRLGILFEDAWHRAMVAHPPRGREAAGPDTLFDVSTGEVEETYVEATKRFCFDAWYGEKPGLRHFSLEMLGGADYTRDAKVTGTGNYARAAA